ncbi:MAG TPA: phytanoyl-CoA dioxygenase family protein [Verrucomicrobiae bacterium]|nr:phytanoyl-CoA dioxygenase family protein [Verrucomicrobiae bacterium]
MVLVQEGREKMGDNFTLTPKRPVSGWRRFTERAFYLANPFRVGNKLPSWLRDSGPWEAAFRAADPIRYSLWRSRNNGSPAAAVPEGPEAAIVASLRRDGIVILPGFVPPDLIAHMERTARSYARAAAGIDIDHPKPAEQTHLNNLGNDLRRDDPILTFLRSDGMLRIAGAYLGFRPRLRRLALFFNQPQPHLEGPDNVEKHFHADTHDFIALKFFIYLHDTVEKNGPFTYVKETNFFGRRRGVVARIPAYSEISSEEMAEFVPASEWVLATGPAGTGIFAETTGVHRGGRTEAGHRLMLVAEYASRHPWIRFDHDIAGPDE